MIIFSFSFFIRVNYVGGKRNQASAEDYKGEQNLECSLNANSEVKDWL